MNIIRVDVIAREENRNLEVVSEDVLIYSLMIWWLAF